MDVKCAAGVVELNNYQMLHSYLERLVPSTISALQISDRCPSPNMFDEHSLDFKIRWHRIRLLACAANVSSTPTYCIHLVRNVRILHIGSVSPC
jgi:hypothetical protein